MPAETQRNPAQTLTLAGLEWPRLMEFLASRVQSAPGHEALDALGAVSSPEEVRARMALISEMRGLRTERGGLDFGPVRPVGPLLERAAKQSRLDGVELLAILATQRAALKVRTEIRALESLPGLAALGEALHLERPLCDLLARSLTPEGTLNTQAFPELGAIESELSARRAAIHAHLERVLRRRDLADALQDTLYTLRGRRYVVPIKADFKGHLAGIVHDVSASGATLFIEPQEVVDETNALTLAERRLELETDRILRELSHTTGESAPNLRANLRWLGALDLLHAQAVLSEGYTGSAPEVHAEGRIALVRMAHPMMLLEQSARSSRPALPGEADSATVRGEVVRNDLELGAGRRCLMISGANTGGKTVLLKAVGLCALLVRHGMHIPALEGSRFDLFQEVWADIGDQQSLEGDLSTFSAQIAQLAALLPHAGPGTLVLLDEMLTGTDPAQGAALGAAVLEHLLARGALTLVTTHFGELKTLAERLPEVVNASVSFDPARLRPTYRLQTGLPGASYGLHIARRHGLPESLVARAEADLAGRPAALDALLIRLQQREADLQRAESRLERDQAALRRAETELDNTRRALAEKERDVRRRERGAVGEELRSARERIAAVIRDLQQANALPVAGRLREELEAVAAQVLAPDAPTLHALPPLTTVAGLEPGAEVWLLAHEARAVLESALDEGRRAKVRLGALQLEVQAGELSLPPPQAPPARRRKSATATATAAEARRPTRRNAPPAPAAAGSAGVPPMPGSVPDVPAVLPRSDNTLDLRGTRLYEALEMIERFFDACVVQRISPVVVIHGHGTGKLKAGIRDALRDNPYVKAYRAGERGEGADGVTVVSLGV
ncbi:MAG: Smr/MutS family protein [Deltaproteobacteria bacterium]|nr:Smr/MutS family protein [Deltaproteobacteria bacterium]